MGNRSRVLRQGEHEIKFIFVWDKLMEIFKYQIVELPMYTKGRLLLELIDMSIFDFLIGNMDRHNFQRFE